MDGLLVFVGSAIKPALEIAIGNFKRLGGPPVKAIYGGSGTMLEQLILRRNGDLFLPATQEFLGIAAERGIIRPIGRRVLAYLTPCLVVQAGNPLDIKTLGDLAKPGIRVAIGNPQHACSGLHAQRLLVRDHLLELVRPNIIAYPDSCEGALLALIRQQVDAIIGWTVFENWAIASGRIQTIPLPNVHGTKARVLVAPSIFSREPQAAEFFASYLSSPEGRKVFAGAGYELPPPASKAA